MNKKLIAIICSVVVVVGIAVGAFFYLRTGLVAQEISVDDAYEIIKSELDEMQGKYPRDSLVYIRDNTDFSIVGIEYGTAKDIIVDVKINTIDAASEILANKEKLVGINPIDPTTKMEMVSTKIKLKIDPILLSVLKEAKPCEKSIKVYIYETKNGFSVHTTDEMADAFFGGTVSAGKAMGEVKSVVVDGEEIAVKANVIRGLNECYALDYSTRKPDASGAVLKAWNNFKYDFHRNFIKNNNWKYITKGLWTTVKVTFFSSIIGIFLGFLVAIVRVTYSKIGENVRNPFLKILLKFSNWICGIYLTVLRGTPVLVQLMIIYFVIFMPLGIDKFISAVLCFGLNSGAYVAEIMRGGIMSVDAGQMEAGRSLGFNYPSTMFHIVLPQAFKAVLPALANEFIVLLKETSISAYIGLNDLARGGDIIRGVTYSAFMPLIAVALIYLVVVVVLSYLVGILERRLRKNER